MALLFMDGFEGYAAPIDMLNSGGTNATRYSQVYRDTNMSFSSSTYRTTQPTASNSRSLYMAYNVSADPYLVISTPPRTELIIGFGVRFNATNTTAESFLMIGGSNPGSSQGVVISYTASTGFIAAHISGSGSGNPGTILGTASGTYSTGVWYYFEARIKLGTSTGEVDLRINGDNVLNVSSVNTATGSLTNYYSLVLKPEYAYMAVFFDDLYICDTTGTTNNTFIGPLSVYSLMPSSNGSTTDLTPTGAASNWEAVDEIANDTTTYVETNTTGAKDYYNFESLPAGVTSVHGVRVKALSTTIDNGGRKVKLNMKNGANTLSSALRTLTLGSWLWDTFLSETAPDGSAWTATSVNATEAGVEAAE